MRWRYLCGALMRFPATVAVVATAGSSRRREFAERGAEVHVAREMAAAPEL